MQHEVELSSLKMFKYKDQVITKLMKTLTYQYEITLEMQMRFIAQLTLKPMGF